MTKHIRVRSASVSMSRRQVMVGVAGLSFAVAFGKSGSAVAAALATERAGRR
jgi:hypothetical protein